MIILSFKEIARCVAKDMLEYDVHDENLLELYRICLNEYGDFNRSEEDDILIKTIHIITILGYDIDTAEPCTFKKYTDTPYEI